MKKIKPLESEVPIDDIESSVTDSFQLSPQETEAFRLLLVQTEAVNFAVSRYISHVSGIRGLDPKQWTPSKDMKFLVKINMDNKEFKVV